MDTQMAEHPALVERDDREGAYGMTVRTIIVQHPVHGRLLLAEGWGGQPQGPNGLAYRWKQGTVCQLRDGDTLESLRAAEWNECTSLLDAVLRGCDATRPALAWTGWMIRSLANAVGC